MKTWLIAGVGALLLAGTVAAGCGPYATGTPTIAPVAGYLVTPPPVTPPAGGARNGQLLAVEVARAEAALQVARLRLALAQAEANLEHLTQASRLLEKQAGALRKDRLTGTAPSQQVPAQPRAPAPDAPGLIAPACPTPGGTGPMPAPLPPGPVGPAAINPKAPVTAPCPPGAICPATGGSEPATMLSR